MKWKCTKEETELAIQIARRTVALATRLHPHLSEEGSTSTFYDHSRCNTDAFIQMTIAMDIEAVHSSNPLRLKDLLEADDTDFAHDVYGIGRNINRTTGELENCFLPRYSC